MEQFEDYYDELFGNNNNDIAINEIEEEELEVDELLTNEIISSITSVQSQKLRLLKKKLILAKALKGLRKLIMLSNLKDDAYDDDYDGHGDLFADGNDVSEAEWGETGGGAGRARVFDAEDHRCDPEWHRLAQAAACRE